MVQNAIEDCLSSSPYSVGALQSGPHPFVNTTKRKAACNFEGMSAAYSSDKQNSKYAFKQLISRRTARAERLVLQLGSNVHRLGISVISFYTSEKGGFFVLVRKPDEWVRMGVNNAWKSNLTENTQVWDARVWILGLFSPLRGWQHVRVAAQPVLGREAHGYQFKPRCGQNLEGDLVVG